MMLCGMNHFVVTSSAVGKEAENVEPECRPLDITHGRHAVAQVFQRRRHPPDSPSRPCYPWWIRTSGRNAARSILCIAVVLRNADEVTLLDSRDRFLSENEGFDASLFSDIVHPNAVVYRKWADALKPRIEELRKPHYFSSGKTCLSSTQKINLSACLEESGDYAVIIMKNMKSMLWCQVVLWSGLVAGTQVTAEPGKMPDMVARDAVASQRLRELDEYWSRVSRAVREGDFEAYQSTCHPLGILVSGNKTMSQPLSSALARWKQEFLDTRSGAMNARVEFRLSKRIGDASTAFETGIFRYESQRKGEAPKVEYVRLEALLLKENGRWQIMMEHQRESTTEQEWLALKE